MKILAPGTLATLNAKVRKLPEAHPGWLKPGRLCRVEEIVFLNKRKRKCWYSVTLLGISRNVIGQVKVPSNWLEPL